MSLKQWDQATRFLHYGLATTVTLQLILSLIMRTPKIGRELTFIENTSFTFHMYIGMIAFVIVITHLIWTIYQKNYRVKPLLIKQDLLLFTKLKLPAGGPRGGLPDLIHLAGLVVITIAACTGCIIFFNLSAGNHLLPQTEGLHLIKETHEFIATFVWIYWSGHVVMAIAHWLTD